MQIAIMCAMEEELNSIVNSLGINCSKIIDGGFELQITNFNDHQLILVVCGIGKVNAAMYTQYIIDRFTPDYIINVGVAGGLSTELNFGDVIVASDLVYHDMNVTAFGIPLGQVPRMDVFAFKCSEDLVSIASAITHTDFKVLLGRIASGDQFIGDRVTASNIFETFNALACEMEGAAIAHVCHVNKVPFLVVRALSDKAGLDDKLAIHSFDELKEMVADRSAFIVRHILLQI